MILDASLKFTREKEGLMKLIAFIVENTWLPNMEHGWGNGYVLIPRGHPAHGMGYENIDVEIHGGLTFAESEANCKPLLLTAGVKFKGDRWVVGFDTAHHDDTQDNWTRERVLESTESLKRQLEKEQT
jgi:hypothetical protein